DQRRRRDRRAAALLGLALPPARGVRVLRADHAPAAGIRGATGGARLTCCDANRRAGLLVALAWRRPAAAPAVARANAGRRGDRRGRLHRAVERVLPEA